MGEGRHHRGPDPSDAELFGPEGASRLTEAVSDASWLQSRGYAENATVALVGDRYRLHRRQRIALRRMACSDADRERRRDKALDVRTWPSSIVIDGFNIVVTVESALGGAVILCGRDGCFRDLAGLRGSYRIVAETEPALRLIGRTLERGGVRDVRWILDRPVSNSGRLAGLLREVAAKSGWTWEAVLEDDADSALLRSGLPVATADSVVLDRCASWLDPGRETIRRCVPGAWVVGAEASTPPGT